MKSYNRLIALTVFYESFNDSYDSATWLPHNHNRVDKQNAVKGRFGVNTAMHYALFAKNAAVLTTRTPWKEAAEKVECFFSPENLIIEMIPDFVLFGIIFSILARLFLSKYAF